MYLSIFIVIILSLIESILGGHVEDNQVIIGSSVGGVLGLVSSLSLFEFEEKKNEILDHFNIRSDCYL